MTETNAGALADKILVGGKIWCGLEEGFAEALAIAGDKVLAAGTRAEIEAMAGDNTEVIDLGGKLATPGLNDAHMHLHMYGFNMRQVDLRARDGVRSVEALVTGTAFRLHRVEHYPIHGGSILLQLRRRGNPEAVHGSVGEFTVESKSD